MQNMCTILKSHDLQKIFAELDRDGNGYIDVVELSSFLNKVGVANASHEELEGLVGRSILDLQDFVAFYESICNKQQSGDDQRGHDGIDDDDERDLIEAFKVFDLNSDGFISSDELESVLLRLEMWEERKGGDCKRMIREFDTNADGLLDFEEFKNMMLLTIP